MLENNYPVQFKPLILGTFVFSCFTQTQFPRKWISQIRCQTHSFRAFSNWRRKPNHSLLPQCVVSKAYCLPLSHRYFMQGSNLGLAANWGKN